MAENRLIQQQNFRDKWRTLLVVRESTEKYKDVYLEFSNDRIAISSLVLAASSPVFEAMLYHECRESITRCIRVDGLFCSFQTLQKFVDFLHGRPIWLLEDDVEDLLNVAVQYFIKDLQNCCCQFLLNRLSSTNCSSTWLLSSLFSMQELTSVCRHLFWQLIPFIIDNQRDIITDLPEWFISHIVLVSKPINFNPQLLLSFLIIWILGNFEVRLYTMISIFIELGVTESTWKDVVTSIHMSNTQKDTILNFYKTSLRPKRHFDTNALQVTNNNHQYLSIMLVDKSKRRAAFFSMESRTWLMSNLPYFDGKALGVISGNILVRVTRGSSANLFNLIRQVSFHTPCILEAVNSSKYTVSLLPTANSYFISNGRLHVAIVVKRVNESKLIIFVYNSSCNAWRFLARYPLSNIRHHIGLYTHSTVDSFVYFIINARVIPSDRMWSNPRFCGVAQVFLFDMKQLRVVSSVCGDSIGQLDNSYSCIIKQNIYFVPNSISLVSSKYYFQKVLQINLFERIFREIKVAIVSPRLESLPLRRDRHQLCTGQLTAVKDSTFCLIDYKGPYVCSFYVWDFEKGGKWLQMPPPPPLFKFSHSKISLIHTYEPVNNILQTSGNDFVSVNERYFATLELDIEGQLE